MEIVYSNKEDQLISKEGIIGIYKDKEILIKRGFIFNSIKYDNEYTVKKFLCNNQTENSIISFFNDIDLDIEILKYKIKDLSSGYLTIILLIYAILNINDTLFLDYIDMDLSYKMKNKIINLLKIRCNKRVVVISNDLIFLNSLCYHLIVFNDNKVLFDGTFEEFYNCKLKIDYPPVVNFIRFVKKTKNIKLSYTIDNKELIKDIYRSIK